jgi:hypothetical protein
MGWSLLVLFVQNVAIKMQLMNEIPEVRQFKMFESFKAQIRTTKEVSGRLAKMILVLRSKRFPKCL